MDEYTYINIFDTKGIEYLVIIVFLILLIPFWLYLNRTVRLSDNIRKAVVNLSVRIREIPFGFFYARNHTWTHLEKDGAARVGLNNLLLNVTGRIQVNLLHEENHRIRKGELLAQIRQDGKHLNIYSPISGQIIGHNRGLGDNPEMVDEDPYGNGWLYSIKPDDWKNETNSYFLAEEASHWLKAEMDRIKDFLAEKTARQNPELAAVILQDGGELSNEILKEMPANVWNDFQKEFLDLHQT
jgi:glycine cleavage system H protein